MLLSPRALELHFLNPFHSLGNLRCGALPTPGGPRGPTQRAPFPSPPWPTSDAAALTLGSTCTAHPSRFRVGHLATSCAAALPVASECSRPGQLCIMCAGYRLDCISPTLDTGCISAWIASGSPARHPSSQPGRLTLPAYCPRRRLVPHHPRRRRSPQPG